nr:MAG TPA: hypothetical protein [Caudoviricetes sp.]
MAHKKIRRTDKIRIKISPWEIVPGAFIVLFWRRNDGAALSR